MSAVSILVTYWQAFAGGLATTALLCGIVWLASFAVGLPLGLVAAQVRGVRGLILGAAAISSGIPAIVLLFWAYYPGQALLGVEIKPFLTACIALSAIGTLLAAQAVCRAIDDFPPQLLTAARVCGLSRRDSMLKIAVPLLVRRFIPTALVIMVNLFQMSLFSAFISVDELFRVTQRINSIVYRPIEIYSGFALFCLIFSLPLYAAAAWLRSRSDNYDIER